MLPVINPAKTTAWKNLIAHYKENKHVTLQHLFATDSNRYTKFSCCTKDLVLDYSKNRITEKTMELLLALAKECQLEQSRTLLFSGAAINATEHRAVLHTALRNFSNQPVFVEGKNVMPAIKKVLRQMKDFCDRIHEGKHRGYTGKRIKYIVNIGIGGSDLGPLMVTEALKPYWKYRDWEQIGRAHV